MFNFLLKFLSINKINIPLNIPILQNKFFINQAGNNKELTFNPGLLSIKINNDSKKEKIGKINNGTKDLNIKEKNRLIIIMPDGMKSINLYSLVRNS